MKEVKASDYSIFIGQESLQAYDFNSYKQLAILVDENTKRDCLPIFLKATNIDAILIEIPSGEEHKNLEKCQLIWNLLSSYHFDRNSLLINLGGGVVGDMGGFAASTYKRGIDFIQIPTSLLAMVDSSVGGKLGVDFAYLKNQIGVFNNPKAVLINPVFLNSLPKNQLLSGFAEVVKHALIADKRYWKEIKITPLEKMNWESIILQSVIIKNIIVTQDPLEKGERKKLNFGHTFGHAIESFYLKLGKPVLHGEAISLGMILESNLSKINNEEKLEIASFISNTFSIPKKPPLRALLEWMKSDKKNRKEKINFTLLNGIGSSIINQEFTFDELLD
tara:strand:- start:4027 stop:5028 length:1002 start_codon:yes stop_codon:yes gene_type:complete